MTWVIDSGHGGIDSGAVGNGVKEKDFTLDVAKRVYKELTKHGVKAVLTKDVDKTIELNARCKLINKLGAKKGVSIHLNAASNKTANGFEFIHSIYSDGKFEGMLKDEFLKIKELKPRPKTIYTRKHNTNDYYAIHRETGSVRMTIIEAGFISNPQDAKFVFSEEGKTKVVNAIVEAILKDEGKKKSVTKEHVVLKGETLYGISKKLGVTVEHLKTKNGLKTNVIQINQKLKY